jgi:hypothetical protein
LPIFSKSVSSTARIVAVRGPPLSRDISPNACGTEHCNCAARAVCQDLYLSARDDVEGVTSVPGPEQDLPGLQLTVPNAWQDLFDLFGRQVPHQIARRQQLYPLFED